MTFVGTRPEVPKYVAQYTPKMMATLLLPAGVTSLASICFKDEDELLAGAEDTDKAYVEQVLPLKMKYNLYSIERFGFWRDIKTMFMTVFAVLGKKYNIEVDDADAPTTMDAPTTDDNSQADCTPMVEDTAIDQDDQGSTDVEQPQ